MRFSLVFENHEEGIGASYDLLFAPCPIWVLGDHHVINLNRDSPYLQPKSVNRLVEKEKLQYVKKCAIIVHNIGHGGEKDLHLIEDDLKDLGMSYRVIRFDEVN